MDKQQPIEQPQDNLAPTDSRARADTPPSRGPILRRWWLDTAYNQVIGEIYNDPKQRWPDGMLIHTSTVQWIDEKRGLVQTLNTLYLLQDKAP